MQIETVAEKQPSKVEPRKRKSGSVDIPESEDLVAWCETAPQLLTSYMYGQCVAGVFTHHIHPRVVLSNWNPGY